MIGRVKMHKEGVVSLWVGHAPSTEALEEYVQTRYSADGDRIPSPFAEEFSLSRYEDECREAEVLDEPVSAFPDVLAGFSYDDVIVPRFIAAYGKDIGAPSNAVVLLYNYQHQQGGRARAASSVKLRFVGAVPYR